MKVIIQKDIYDRSKDIFDESNLEMTPFPLPAEKEMIQFHQQSDAACFILGAEAYSDDFFYGIRSNSLIIRYGVGYDKIPIDICKERRLLVAYTPNTLDQSVGEHTIALMLSLARSIPSIHLSMKRCEWHHTQGVELKGKTLCIAGFGNIGRRVARIAKYGLEMNIRVFDVFPEPNRKYWDLFESYSRDFPRAVRGADFVSLHMSANKENEGFIDYNRIKLMEKRAFLINTSRGSLVKETHLYDALKEKLIAGAALDVYNTEPYIPVDRNKDLRELNSILLTSHISSNTDNANSNMARDSIRNAMDFYHGNLEKISLIPEMRS